MSVTHVDNEELLYRRVPMGRGLYQVADDGTIRISSQAFADRNQRPSVDRARLRNLDPSRTQLDPTDGVISLLVGDVRAIDTLQQPDVHGNISQVAVDVEHVPLPDNHAHAEIYTVPPATKSAFRRLRERLTQLANQHPWEIKPADVP